MKIVMLPYNMVSESAKAIAKELGIIRIKREKSKYQHKADNVIINWGCPNAPTPEMEQEGTVINPFDCVRMASNKVSAFEMMQGKTRIPWFTTEKEIANEWIEEGRTVVVRHVLNGHSGEGIELIGPDDFKDASEAPLYTVYVPKKSEYRVHIIGGQIIDVARKTLKDDHPNKENVNWKIRNLDNGFIFSRFNKRVLDENGNPKLEMNICPIDVKIQSFKAIKALGLDFGAVDVIYNEKSGNAYVLEVNTAPGHSEELVTKYAKALTMLIEKKANPPKRPWFDLPNQPIIGPIVNDDF